MSSSLDLSNIEAFSKSVILEMKEAGDISSLPHIIIHEVVSDDPEKIEDFCTAAIKVGLDVGDPFFMDESLIINDPDSLISKSKYPEGCFVAEVVFESPLLVEEVLSQSKKILPLVSKYELDYALWGSFLETGESDEEYLENEELLDIDNDEIMVLSLKSLEDNKEESL